MVGSSCNFILGPFIKPCTENSKLVKIAHKISYAISGNLHVELSRFYIGDSDICSASVTVIVPFGMWNKARLQQEQRHLRNRVNRNAHMWMQQSRHSLVQTAKEKAYITLRENTQWLV